MQLCGRSEILYFFEPEANSVFSDFRRLTNLLKSLFALEGVNKSYFKQLLPLKLLRKP